MTVLIKQFRLDLGTDQALRARYNIAPTQDIPVVRQTDDGRELAIIRWGLIPSWSKEMNKGPLLINARCETVAEKPSFRSAFKSRRCLIPADGYYEWQAVGQAKQPYFFQVKGDAPFAFAGLWERWQSIESCVIITTAASEWAAQFHDRMPVILSPHDYAEWLSPDTKQPGQLLTPRGAVELTATAVNPIVNNARNETPACIEPIA